MDVNDRMALLGAVPVHPGLEQLDGAVLARRAEHDRSEARNVSGLVAAAALGIGVVSGLTPVEESATIMPFGPPVALTPLIAFGQG